MMSAFPVVGQTVFMFCNGIWNSKKGAKASAQIIEKAFGNGVKAEVFPNSSGLKNVFDCNGQLSDHNKKLVKELSDKIQEYIRNNIKLVVFAHSHGAFLVKEALRGSVPNKNITVYALGGIAFVPEAFAEKVRNYSNKQDTLPFVLAMGKLEKTDGCVKVIDEHGEFIRVKSDRVNQGSDFSVNLVFRRTWFGLQMLWKNQSTIGSKYLSLAGEDRDKFCAAVVEGLKRMGEFGIAIPDQLEAHEFASYEPIIKQIAEEWHQQKL